LKFEVLMITLRHFSHRYPRSARPALADVDLHLPEGAFALIAGPSGAGKSTLLRALNGLTPHFSGGQSTGTLSVAGRDPIADGPAVLSRSVGFVFQDPEAQFVVDQVEDEVAFALENAGLPVSLMRERIEDSLSRLGLTDLRRRHVGRLSGGEMQRVAIASALALRPRVLALDEPTSQLDPQSAEELLDTLARLNRELGLTVVLSEHRLERVAGYATHAIYLGGDGQAPVCGPTRQVLPHIPLVPPVVELGRAFGWQPLPLTVEEGLPFARRSPLLTTAVAERSSGEGPGVRPGEVAFCVRDLHVAYADRPVLRGIDLAVREGEIVVLMGRNGAGKTTLLRAIAGLARAQQGEVAIGGRSIAGRSVADICRSVGYLPQNPNALLFADTVREEILITLRNHGLQAHPPIPPAGLLERLALSGLADVYPRDLSAGERQRVALAAITATHPALLLLDEPTRGLDYCAKEALLKLLQEWRDDGMAILLVTHDVELAARVADRVVLLEEGKIRADGSPVSVLGDSPAFAPQMARLFPGRGWLTVEDVLSHLSVNGVGGA
jgi:energy-coupling factor transport system ATP-binding protein